MSKVIMYHYIRNFNKNLPYLNFLHIRDFKKQINYFKKEKERLAKIQDNLDEILKKKKFILTFDDGLKDHLKIAKYLKKKNILGLFFITVQQFLNSDFLSIHKLHLIFGKFPIKKIYNIILKNKIKINYNKKSLGVFKLQKNFLDKKNPHSEKNLKIFLKTTLNNLQGSNRKIIDKIFDNLFLKKDQKKIFKNFYLNKKDIKYLDKIGMIIGSHGFDHNVLSKKNYSNQKEDIISSCKILSNILGKEIKYFCYPYGGSNVFNKNTIKILKKIKIKYCFNVNSKNWTQKSNKLSIPRYDCNEFKFGKIYKYN